MRDRFQGGDYVQHFNPDDDDKLMILACQVRIWNAGPDNWNAGRPGIAQLTEVLSIDITNSFKDPISTCVLKFPRGTMISKSIKNDGLEENVETGHKSSPHADENKLSKATNDADVEVPGSSIDKSGGPVLSVWADRNEYGILKVGRAWGSRPIKDLVSESDFGNDSRIEIKAGYVYTEDDYDAVKTGAEHSALSVIFSGKIVSCAMDSMVEVKCESLMSVLRSKRCPPIMEKNVYHVNDFLAPGGKYKLLAGTGLSLSGVSQSANISVGKPAFNANNTPLDLFHQWAKGGVATFLEEDGVTIRVAYTYNSESRNEGNMGYVGYGNGAVTVIQSDWHVASENLGWSHIDKRWIAVKASTSLPDGKRYKQMSVLYRNVASDPDETVDSFTNIHGVTHRKKMKFSKGARGMNRVPDQPYVMDKDYMVVKYEVPYEEGMTIDKLKQMAKEYYKKYSNIGVQGSVTCFGDVQVVPGQIICYINPMEPLKNGYYLVEAVNVRFGMQGYRKELKMAYRVEPYDKKIVYIAED